MSVPSLTLSMPVKEILFLKVGNGFVANQLFQFIDVDRKTRRPFANKFGEQRLELGDVVGRHCFRADGIKLLVCDQSVKLGL